MGKLTPWAARGQSKLVMASEGFEELSLDLKRMGKEEQRKNVQPAN